MCKKSFLVKECLTEDQLRDEAGSRKAYDDRYKYPKWTIEWIAAKNDPLSHLSYISQARYDYRVRLAFAVARPAPVPEGRQLYLKDSKGRPAHSIGHIGNGVCRLDIMQLPLALPLADQLPAEDSI